MPKDGLCAALQERLEQESCLQLLSLDDVEHYELFELADAIAMRAAVNVEPEDLRDTELRAQWYKRVLDGEIMNEPFMFDRRPYWVVSDGQRIGTIAFAVIAEAATPTIEISSVYVRPHYRRRGWASRILGALRDAAFEVGFRRAVLQVEWNNQDALQFYCAQGMWVASWKSSIELYFAKDQPRWQIEVLANEAHFKVKGRVAAVARSQGRHLDWSFKKTTDKQLKWPVEQTAALQLALLRWPIIRSDKLWQQQINKGWSDSGPFEGFALRLRQIERQIRRKGWNVPAERNPSFATLPGLSEVGAHDDRLVVLLSDGARLVVPFAALGLASDVLGSVHFVEDEVICTLQSGTPLIYNVDYLLYLTQSPEHLARATELVRQTRAAARR